MTDSDIDNNIDNNNNNEDDDQDVDLARARDLLRLHAGVKLAHQAGVDRTLGRARDDVARALRAL